MQPVGCGICYRARMEISREVVLDATPDEVWRLVTDEAELSSWLADSVSFEPRPGAAGALVDNGATWRLRVDEVSEVDAARRLRFTWWPDAGGPASEVSMIVEETADGGGTRLRVRERFRGGVSLKGRRADAGLWDDRLLGLELRCLSRASLAHC
jgi:uncharacterized protein YndB with AHSA1/START domain